MRIVADFHIHSKYSRATSRDMEIKTLERFARAKGINLLGTGDFTHPEYFSELKAALEPLGNGLFRLKGTDSPVRFILTVEVSNIFSVRGTVKRVHTIVIAPSFEAVSKINRSLGRRGKLASDGRPVFGFHVKETVKLVLDASADCLVVPAHAWTPWFSVFGSASGFDSLEECFQEEAANIHAIETGLSSDPAMNWRLSGLDRITLLSNSDAHSPSRIGREANVFDCEMDYREITEVIRQGDPEKFLYTVEFYPEEGKYHWDGHRACGVAMPPSGTRDHDFTCPECGKKMTVGVMHRVESLADRPAGVKPEGKIPFRNMVPLDEIIAAAFGQRTGTKAVKREYDAMISSLGPEIEILLERTEAELKPWVKPAVLKGILKVRSGDVRILPGYDGCYGRVSFEDGEDDGSLAQQPLLQERFF